MFAFHMGPNMNFLRYFAVWCEMHVAPDASSVVCRILLDLNITPHIHMLTITIKIGRKIMLIDPKDIWIILQ